MRFRRTLSGLLAAAVLLSSGCMQKKEINLEEESTAESSAPSVDSTAEESAAAADPVSELLSALNRDTEFSQFPETPASDFEWEEDYVQDELVGIKITGYTGSDPTVRIPEKINGVTVNIVNIQNGGAMETLAIPACVLNIWNDCDSEDGSGTEAEVRC